MKAIKLSLFGLLLAGFAHGICGATTTTTEQSSKIAALKKTVKLLPDARFYYKKGFEYFQNGYVSVVVTKGKSQAAAVEEAKVLAQFYEPTNLEIALFLDQKYFITNVLPVVPVKEWPLYCGWFASFQAKFCWGMLKANFKYNLQPLLPTIAQTLRVALPIAAVPVVASWAMNGSTPCLAGVACGIAQAAGLFSLGHYYGWGSGAKAVKDSPSYKEMQKVFTQKIYEDILAQMKAELEKTKPVALPVKNKAGV